MSTIATNDKNAAAPASKTAALSDKKAAASSSKLQANLSYREENNVEAILCKYAKVRKLTIR